MMCLSNASLRSLTVNLLAGTTSLFFVNAVFVRAVSAAPIEYVRVCDNAGVGSSFAPGFYYIPGTDKCAYSNNLPYTYQTPDGQFSTQPGTGAAAYGTDAFSNGTNSVAIGDHAFSGGDPFSASPGASNGIDDQTPNSAFSNANTTAIGQGSRAGATAAGQNNATAIGQGALANALNTTAIGQGATAAGARSVVVGQGATDNAVSNSVVLGQGASIATTATGANVALGQGSVANRGASANYVGFGLPTVQSSVGEVAIGTAVGNRQLTGVAAGSSATDAVNVSQLQAVGSNIAIALGGGANLNAVTGAFTAPSYNVQGGTYNNVGSAIGALDVATTANTQNITSLQNGTSGPFRANNTSGYSAAQATGADAISGGFGSVASGTASTAIGTGAQATQAGAVAIGAFAQASADPTTAVGFAAAATGNEASAFGAFATASGTNSTALGRSANAAGPNSVAVGFGASATQANSVAIGTGVATTRANQVAIGTASQTYTLAGLTSAQSLAAQSGSTGFVTTDAAGNLAASNYGPSSIAALDGRVGNLENSVAGLQLATARLQRQVRDAFSGTAVALSLTGAVLPEGKTYAVSGGFGTYHGSTAVGFTGIVRLSDNVFASGGVGFGTSGRSNVGGRGSLMYAW
ncbi:hypothetical protein MKK65_08115 [Methylobacterium sp. J-001]|uniref:YadA-like family protein n=1 Tax=Methylobacterium sp. J-001 TaxID=2836609 RepID=UPI001FB9D772|nr:hypothetical protein [Methylobacterium sp. J-001]MCJ2116544.1 hypothetical protein [Methylobacterium sp. J-001]